MTRPEMGRCRWTLPSAPSSTGAGRTIATTPKRLCPGMRCGASSASDDHGFAVYFREEGPEILVIALHGRQDPRQWQQRS
jgi:hypothetical protein